MRIKDKVDNGYMYRMKSKVFRLVQTTLLGVTQVRAAWQFPHTLNYYSTAQKPLGGPSGDDDVDISYGSQFHGLTTYANIPYVNCFSDEAAEGSSKYDIAILGAPFDTVDDSKKTCTNRLKGENALKSWANVVDCGDVPLTFLDNNYALAQLTKGHKVVSGRKAANQSYSVTPRIITLGGDHTTTLPALRSVHKHWGKVSVIHFDSHLDTWDPQVLTALTTGLIRNSSIHAGIRGQLASAKGDIRNDERCGFAYLTARDLDRFGVSGIVSRIRDRVTEPVYISVDIDVLDPAFAPGTPEPGGWSTRELLAILDGLTGLEVVGADVVEVAPAYDTRGETTTLAAAEVVWSFLELMIATPVKSLADRASS
ncbi:hypothetical protein FHL15_004035 [Xylaria flabelliformis]|uniref:Agmatinase n=1 Tax=Xylaria flabelliformis TaxID=2512241 RepID=A0A553I419_9PEZI|nr:hypothetical protein FHL15_004035 [Xylaria flabelliformis]